MHKCLTKNNKLLNELAESFNEERKQLEAAVERANEDFFSKLITISMIERIKKIQGELQCQYFFCFQGSDSLFGYYHEKIGYTQKNSGKFAVRFCHCGSFLPGPLTARRTKSLCLPRRKCL